ncbi:hypothetical protein GCM10022222_19690 [Amycolatopsis ultiminotia]|uniref:Uncharacterized protein n=1 Tax=Amycolatopsis ultiminotia TaxID=543629 RepID=A0ABP6VMR1_9PSEU
MNLTIGAVRPVQDTPAAQAVHNLRTTTDHSRGDAQSSNHSQPATATATATATSKLTARATVTQPSPPTQPDTLNISPQEARSEYKSPSPQQPKLPEPPKPHQHSRNDT